MMIDTPNFSIQIRRRQNDKEYPDLKYQAMREKSWREKEEERHEVKKNNNKTFSPPFIKNHPTNNKFHHCYSCFLPYYLQITG